MIMCASYYLYALLLLYQKHPDNLALIGILSGELWDNLKLLS
jgi:hypothetical protein